MRKAFSLVLLCVCVFFAYQFGINFIKQTHTITYEIKSDRVFEIKEMFRKNSYYFEIVSDDYTFYYKDENLFNKMKNVIEDIKLKEENGMLCIYPVYKNQKPSTIICSDKRKVIVYDVLKNNFLVSNFYNELTKDGHKFKFNIVEEEVIEEADVATYYPENFGEKEVVTLWNYQGFTIYNNDRYLNVYTFDFDRYENTISRLVNKYYVVPIYQDNKLFEFNKVLLYDIFKNQRIEVELNQTLSNYTYVNGIIDNKLYLMDPANVIQVMVDVRKKESQVVGNKEKNGIYYFGNVSQKKNIYDFVNRKIYFEIDDTVISSRYSYKTSYETKDSYYFYGDNGLYRVYKDKLDLPILIQNKNNLREIKVIDDSIYYILEDKIYKYVNNRISVPLVVYDELLYNNVNIYDVYK